MENHYARKYNERSLLAKIRKFARKAGQQVIYAVLLLFYVMKDPGVGMKTKLTIAAALGYFIVPTDAIFDLAPILGFTDDLGVLIYALVRVSSTITPAIKARAREKLQEWFKSPDERELLALEEKISAGNPAV